MESVPEEYIEDMQAVHAFDLLRAELARAIATTIAQTAEIDNLRISNDAMARATNGYVAEIERLRADRLRIAGLLADVMRERDLLKVAQQDFDGFGVLHCKACGYCVHPSCTGGVCDICGQVQP